MMYIISQKISVLLLEQNESSHIHRGKKNPDKPVKQNPKH